MKRMYCFNDPGVTPGSGLPPETVLGEAIPVVGTAGEAYTLRRGIPVEVAAAAGLKFHSDFGGRPAVLAALRDRYGRLASVHGRYLTVRRGQNKMLTVGPGDGGISFLGGWQADPFILVEGLFDGLSLAACGWPSVAGIGRRISWLPEVTAGRVVWGAFDAGRPGEDNYRQALAQLRQADLRRLPPPPGCKDWNTALVKRGALAVSRWVRDHVTVSG